MNKIILIFVTLIITTSTYAAGLPSGSSSPEGIACDMATAFINADKELWNKVVLKLENSEYKNFIDEISKEMDIQANLPKHERIGPKLIGIVFTVGKLSKNGPNSYAYAAKNLDQIGFVDIGVLNHDGTQSMNRTFVAKKESTWYALPRPDLFPLLTVGLNAEPATKNIVYQLK